MIRRGKRPEGNFYVLDKAISEDRRLSWAALPTLLIDFNERSQMTNSLETLRALSAERIALNKKLAPLHARSATLRSELSTAQSAITAADAALESAVQNHGLVDGRVLIGEATAADAKQAKQARQGAETAHSAAQAQSAGVRALAAEIAGLDGAGRELGGRLVELDREVEAANERYLRDLADEAAQEYADLARALALKLASVFAHHQVLAAVPGINPDLLTPGVWGFSVPSLNSASARTPHGSPIVGIDQARAQQPAALADIRARLLADGVTVPGLF